MVRAGLAATVCKANRRNLESEISTNRHCGDAPLNDGGANASPAFPSRCRIVVRVGLSVAVLLGLAAGIGGLTRGVSGQTAGPTSATKAGSPAAPGASASQAPAAATLQVFSRLTVVDVTVTDSKGQPVHNLKESDFTVKEDGKPQPLRSFQEVREDAPPVVRVPPALPPNVYTNLLPAPPTSAVNIVLLDALNTASVDQMAMKKESIKFLKSMPRGTRVAVLGLSNRLRILQGFTADPAILTAVIDSKKNRALPSPFIDNDSASLVGDQVDAQADAENDDAAAGLQQFQNEMEVMQQDMRNRMTLEALNQIAAYVHGIKGRKNLIWFTAGMPLNMFPTGGSNDLQAMTDYSKDLRKTTDLLTAGEVAVYPIDARRLFNNPQLDATNQISTITVKTASKVAANNMQFQQKKSQELLGMEAVAQATGGVAYYNTNDLKTAVMKAIENGANYYTVSYVPASPEFDGRYHAVEVEVNRPGLHLGYRRGYNSDDLAHNAITPELTLATTAPEPYGNHMLASMGRGVPTSTELAFDVRVVPIEIPAKATDPPVMGTLDPKLAGKPLVRYELQYLLPSRQITFNQGADGLRKCSLEFDVAAYDVYGKLITGLSQTVTPPPLSGEQYPQFLRKPLQFFQQIDLPPGEIFLRIGIHDVVSQKVGTLEIPLNVKKKAAQPVDPAGAKSAN